MSNDWIVDHPILVKGDKNVHEVFEKACGLTDNATISYFTAGGCAGSANSAEKALLA